MAQNDTPGADKSTDELRLLIEKLRSIYVAYDGHGDEVKSAASEAADFLERATLAAVPASEPEVRCQCCGYLVTESEHKGCLRAAAPAPVSGMPDLASNPAKHAIQCLKLYMRREAPWPNGAVNVLENFIDRAECLLAPDTPNPTGATK